MLKHSEYRQNIDSAAEYILKKMGRKAEVAVILGSGLSDFADQGFTQGTRHEIKYADIPHLPITTVHGHRGKMYYGDIRGKFAVCFAGRFHSYEGHAGPVLTLLPQLAKAIGCQVYVLTNAAGGTKKGMKTGCLMSIDTHASTVRFNPLFGFEAINAEPTQVTEQTILKIKDSNYPFSINSNEIYSKQLLDLADSIANDKEYKEQTSFELKGELRTVELHHGTYVFNSGPNYESHTEIQEIIELSPGTVGMSSVPEALAARMLGMHVYGMSLVTNLGAGLDPEKLSHEDVQEVAKKMSKSVEKLIGRLIGEMDIAKLQAQQPWGEVKTDFDMVQQQTDYCSYDEAKQQVEKFAGCKRCIIYSDCVFNMYKDGQTLFVQSPKSTTNYQATLVLQICQQMNITDIKVLDKSLPPKTMISASNVKNNSGQHVPVDFGKKHLPKKEGQSLMIFDQLEDPYTNVLQKSIQKAFKIDHLTNKVSALFAVIGRLVNMEVYYCSVDMHDAETNNQQVEKFDCDVKSKFGVFNVHQVKPFEITELATKFGAYKLCIISDAEWFYKRGEQIMENIYADGDVLFIHNQQIQKGAGLTESNLEIRILKFLKVDQVVIITDKSSVKGEKIVVKDVINFTGLNTLRGENFQEFGNRFPDLSNICNEGMAAKLGYETGIFTMNLDAEYQGEGKQLYSGALMNLITVVHQQMKVVAVVAPQAAVEEIEKKLLQ
uniref:purine-nucleoside phosphorylase n=1 Tax=Trepomonas sp. PC1 TaxID=1076344 RepID=A0A146K5W3_9EUKA|eukprot:JAP92270.1 Purine nucleoside phosphorylase [Trepomonas sp. PC1]